MKTKTIFFTSLLLISATLFTSCGNKQKPMDNAMDNAIILLKEQNFDLAFEKFNLVIEKEPHSILSVSNICFDEAAVLRTKGNNEGAEKIFNYAIKIIKGESFKIINGESLPENFFKYLHTINNTDSVFAIVLKLMPDYSYDFVADLLMSNNFTNNQIHPAKCISNYDGYTTEIWLKPLIETDEFNNKIFGISNFNPVTSSILSNTSLEEINSITPKAFTIGIKSDLMFLTESTTNGLRYSSIPELKDVTDKLKLKDDLEIVGERKTIINKIIKLREKYLVANLKYIFSRFSIPGKCFVAKRNFNLNNEDLTLHLSLDYYDPFGSNSGIYIATFVIPVSINEAKKLFAEKDEYYTSFNFIVSVSNSRVGIGLAGGGASKWIMPNFYLSEEPLISIEAPNLLLKFKTEGLKGILWNSGIDPADLRRWDMHSIYAPNSLVDSRSGRGIRL